MSSTALCSTQTREEKAHLSATTLISFGEAAPLRMLQRECIRGGKKILLCMRSVEVHKLLTDEYVTPKSQKTSRPANRVTFFVDVLMFQCSGVSVLVMNDKIQDIC